MTTLLDLPEELLLMVLEDVPRWQLCRVKTVCQAMYRLAHLVLLRLVTVKSPDAINAFLAFIDRQTDPSYIRAVKKIKYCYSYKGHVRFDKDLAERLFFRFPNLKDITMRGEPPVTERSTDELCKTVLENCPNLDTFKAHLFCCSERSYCDLIYKVRLLQTEIDLDFAHHYDIVDRFFGGIQQFARHFPRLQKIYGSSIDIDNFERLLQIVEVAPQLRYIDLRDFEKDKEEFSESFFATKTISEQDAIKKTLSNITSLKLTYDESLCSNAMKFAAKYLTGLESFSINNNYREDEWTGSQEEAFIYVLDILGFVKNDCKIDMYSMNLGYVAAQLPLIMQKIFCQIHFKNTSQARTLRITLTETSTASGEQFLKANADLHYTFNKQTNEQVLKIKVSSQFTLQELVAKSFLSTTPFDSIDKFVLSFDPDPYSRSNLRYQYKKPINIRALERIFEVMATSKELVLELPASSISETNFAYVKRYPRLEKLTLRATPDTGIQPLLKTCSASFPNLKYLAILYYTGEWNEELLEFRLMLPKYNLSKLTVDLTPVQTKKGDLEYFVLETRFVSKSKRNLYIVSLDLETVFKVNDEDLDTFFNGQQYVRVYIIAKSLKALELWMYPDPSQFINYLEQDGDLVKRTIIT